MNQNFDFNALSFEIIDGNVNASPDIFLNQNSITFTRKVLDVLNYPSHVLFMIDAKKSVFAIRACKSNEGKAFKFSKTKEDQKATVSLGGKNLLEPIRKCLGNKWEKNKRYKITGFWVSEAKTLCFDLNELLPESYHITERETADEE